LNQAERRLLVEVLALALHLAMRAGQMPMMMPMMMPMIGQDLKLAEVLPPAFDLLGENRVQSFIYRGRQDLTAELRAEDDVIATDVDDIVVAAHGTQASSIT
jgi:hypothetical protein